MRLAVCISTYGRPALARQTLERLDRQSRPPDAVFVSAPDEGHIERSIGRPFPTYYLFGARGSSVQRNRALPEIVAHFDAVQFFDDDFLAADDYLANAERAFDANEDWVVLTGHVLRDGINGSGVAFDEAAAIVDSLPPMTIEQGSARDWHGGYGCNMAVRVSSIGSSRFDERLVLYGWLEDLDFTRRVGAEGRIIHHTSLRGVHMGIKSGRVNGAPLGYAQVVNPFYLLRKGSVTPAMALKLIGRNVLANSARLLWPEPWIDRRGRLRGNLIAARHLLTGKVNPEGAADLLQS